MNNFNNFNVPYGTSQFGQNSWNQPVGPGYPQIDTNLIFVTGLDEALHLSNRRGSDRVYFHQDKDEFYRVKVDMEGRKTWFTFSYTAPNPDASTPATKADLSALVARLEVLEQKFVTEVPQNGESNG